jgi:hypothetical protein
MATPAAAIAPATSDSKDPAVHAFVVAPNDGVDLSNVTRGLYVGVSGDVSATMFGGETVLFKAVPVGVLPVRLSRIMATGTGATNMVGLY